ncbi:hypothetical protein [Flammeovirga pacifica]|uniref:DUF4440 domain-containing protein n=1 Tax=Flammeovirga pacifica TaxID=915059 RepID=A0A1S1YVY4_FLAPC|nr:hypothetical protein [Flammeovirga pacifica]OHX65170.1 hypothetical protein NH26_01780 [Flammeovirga pacifica]
MKRYLFLITLLLSSLYGTCQIKNSFKTIDGVLNELLEQISISKGEQMDTAAIRTIFLPTAQFSIRMQDTDTTFVETVTLNEFLELITDPYYEEGYSEKHISRVIDQYKGIAQVFESFKAKDSEGENGRGISSYQMIELNGRWWVTNILWTNESKEHPIPEKYLIKD